MFIASPNPLCLTQNVAQNLVVAHLLENIYIPKVQPSKLQGTGETTTHIIAFDYCEWLYNREIEKQ